MQKTVEQFVEGKAFQYVIIGLIIVNAIILGLETSPFIMDHYGSVLNFIDNVILIVFIIEIAFRLFAHRLSFFKRPWSVFDLIVVSIALIPASEAFATLRALRVLRVLRLISTIKSMRRVVEGLLSAIPGILSVSVIILLLFYVFAVIGTHLFSAAFPDWFGTIGKTMFTLFQIMTLESWSMGIVRPVMELYPYSWVYFISYILVSTFTMLNLFIAIIVNAMHQGTDENAEESRNELKKSIQELETKVLNEIAKIKK